MIKSIAFGVEIDFAAISITLIFSGDLIKSFIVFSKIPLDKCFCLIIIAALELLENRAFLY